MSTDNSMFGFHKGREVVYSVMSRLFLNTPDDEQHKMLIDTIESLKLIASDSEDQSMKDSVAKLDRFVKDLKTLKVQDLEQYKLDHLRAYTQLFCLGASAPISESYYTSVEKLVMQESRDDALRIYRENGFKMKSDSNEPDDHLSYELMFMSYLSSKSAENVDNAEELNKLLQLQSSFLKGHILNWLDGFIEKLKQNPASEKFYLPLSYFLLSFIKSDLEFLD